MTRANLLSRRKSVELDCQDCPIHYQSGWNVLEGEDLEAINRGKKTLAFAKGQTLFRQGDSCNGIFCMVSGTIAVRKSDEQGNAVLLALKHGNHTLGIRAYFGGTEHHASAEALTPVVVCYIPDSVLRAKMVERSELGLQFLREIAGDLDHANDMILANTTLPVRTRLAQLLLTLKEQFAGVDSDGAFTLEIPMTRHDMADLLATRPETVARAITSLKREGLVIVSGRQATIPNTEALRREIELAAT